MKNFIIIVVIIISMFSFNSKAMATDEIINIFAESQLSVYLDYGYYYNFSRPNEEEDFYGELGLRYASRYFFAEGDIGTLSFSRFGLKIFDDRKVAYYITKAFPQYVGKSSQIYGEIYGFEGTPSSSSNIVQKLHIDKVFIGISSTQDITYKRDGIDITDDQTKFTYCSTIRFCYPVSPYFKYTITFRFLELNRPVDAENESHQSVTLGIDYRF